MPDWNYFVCIYHRTTSVDLQLILLETIGYGEFKNLRTFHVIDSNAMPTMCIAEQTCGSPNVKFIPLIEISVAGSLVTGHWSWSYKRPL